MLTKESGYGGLSRSDRQTKHTHTTKEKKQKGVGGKKETTKATKNETCEKEKKKGEVRNVCVFFPTVSKRLTDITTSRDEERRRRQKKESRHSKD